MNRKQWFVVGLLLVLSSVLIACSGGVAASSVVCPINYDAVDAEECTLSTSQNNPNPKLYEVTDALMLEENQVGIFRPPGDREVIIAEGIGFKEIPAKYSYVIPLNERTLFSERTCAGKMSEAQALYGECDTQLDGIRISDGSSAAVPVVADYEVIIEPIVNYDTKNDWVSLGGYREFTGKFHSHIRTNCRDAVSITYDLTAMQTFQKFCHDSFGKFEYGHLMKLKSFRIRSFGAASQAGVVIESDQALREAEAFATRTSIVCTPEMTADECSLRAAVFEAARTGVGMPDIQEVNIQLPESQEVQNPEGGEETSE